MGDARALAELREHLQRLEDYVKRCDYELQCYQIKYGEVPTDVLPAGTGGEVNYGALSPLIFVYDKRIRVLEEELEKLRACEAVNEQLRGENIAAKSETNRIAEELRAETQKLLALHSKHNDAAGKFECAIGRMKVLEADNTLLLHQRKELASTLEKTQERNKCLENENRGLIDAKCLLQQAIQAAQGKESTLTRRLAEAKEDVQKAQTDAVTAARQAEAERLQVQSLQLQLAEVSRQLKEATEEVDSVKREGRRLLKDSEAGKQGLSQLQQNELELLRKLKEAFDELEECKLQLSSASARETQKDQQLGTLREQMRQLLAVQAETHSRHSKVVLDKHKAQLEELKEELKAKDIEISALKAQLEKFGFEKRLKEREVEALRKECGGGPGSSVCSSTLFLGAGAGGGCPGMPHESRSPVLSQCVYIEELQSRVQRFTLERDEFARRLDNEIHRHKREDREHEVLVEQLRNAICERERKLQKAEADLRDCREELQAVQKESDRLAKQLQSLRLQKEDLERRAEIDQCGAVSTARAEVERMRLLLEEANHKAQAADGALTKMSAGVEERERRAHADSGRERERLEA
eukprot:RCo033795